ncbi:hypothetical protein K9N68_02380 [Kovacikia minuta CCNUW1]|uniref:hypothetical protein n=1 Tax=Kovacikia minuta TaxID=2931930 RepID=UPI001CCF202B|nr:hypothetical protein [Kovacikia minuta]UBF26856.1 hypothetical protein K9N68_02380 [Kovacikia minuta CCNUW1]
MQSRFFGWEGGVDNKSEMPQIERRYSVPRNRVSGENMQHNFGILQKKPGFCRDVLEHRYSISRNRVSGEDIQRKLSISQQKPGFCTGVLAGYRSAIRRIPISLIIAPLSFFALPVWSLPSDQVSRSAIDLVAADDLADETDRKQTELIDKRLPQGEDSSTTQITFPVPSGVAQPSVSSVPPSAANLDLDPNLINSSPVLQRWLKKVPDIQKDIRNDPAFRTRLRLGYSQFPSTHQAGGWNIGLEDLFIGRTGLTVSGDYQASFNGNRKAGGADLRYYVLPLGSFINLAPVLGYRSLETTRYSSDGLNAGLRLLLVPSRTGAADISLTQSWVAPGTDAEVGLTTLSFGYAITHNLRLATDIQKQNARQRKDSRVGILLEWMF